MGNMPIAELLLAATTVVSFAAGSIYTYFVFRKEALAAEERLFESYEADVARYKGNPDVGPEDPESNVEEVAAPRLITLEEELAKPVTWVNVVYSRADGSAYLEDGTVAALEFPEGALDDIGDEGTFSYYDADQMLAYQVEVV